MKREGVLYVISAPSGAGKTTISSLLTRFWDVEDGAVLLDGVGEAVGGVIVSRFGDDGEYRVESAKMLATVLHLHRGTPYIYQGEELGLTNMTFGAISEYRDIEVLNHHREATTHLAVADRHGLVDAAAGCGHDGGGVPRLPHR